MSKNKIISFVITITNEYDLIRSTAFTRAAYTL